MKPIAFSSPLIEPNSALSIDELSETLSTYIHEEIEKGIIRAIPDDWQAAYMKVLEHMRAVENSRNDLMGLNQELREKIGALERGQLGLQEVLEQFQTVLHWAVLSSQAMPYDTSLVNTARELLKKYPLTTERDPVDVIKEYIAQQEERERVAAPKGACL